MLQDKLHVLCCPFFRTFINLYISNWYLHRLQSALRKWFFSSLFLPVRPFPFLFMVKTNPHTIWDNLFDKILFPFAIDAGECRFLLFTEFPRFIPGPMFVAEGKVTIWNAVNDKRTPSWIATCAKS